MDNNKNTYYDNKLKRSMSDDILYKRKTCSNNDKHAQDYSDNDYDYNDDDECNDNREDDCNNYDNNFSKIKDVIKKYPEIWFACKFFGLIGTTALALYTSYKGYKYFVT